MLKALLFVQEDETQLLNLSPHTMDSSTTSSSSTSTAHSRQQHQQQQQQYRLRQSLLLRMGEKRVLRNTQQLLQERYKLLQLGEIECMCSWIFEE